jgi:tetratricopeptide (TPR) repeat protein
MLSGETMRAMRHLATMHTLIGGEHVRAWRVAEAEPHLRAALAIDPDQDVARKLLGDTFAIADRAEEAIEVFRDLLTRHPDQPAIKGALGSTQLAMGDLANDGAIGPRRGPSMASRPSAHRAVSGTATCPPSGAEPCWSSVAMGWGRLQLRPFHPDPRGTWCPRHRRNAPRSRSGDPVDWSGR